MSAKSRKYRYRPYWDVLLERAYEIGLKTAEFWESTPLNFSRMCTAYEKRDERVMRHTRLVLTSLYNQNAAKKEDLLRPDQLFPLSFDSLIRRDSYRPRKVRALRTETEMKALNDFFNQPEKK